MRGCAIQQRRFYAFALLLAAAPFLWVLSADETRPQTYGRQRLLGGRKGTLKDLAEAGPPNLAQDAFASKVVHIDAAPLVTREHFTRRSKPFAIKPDTDYTFLVEVKGEGTGYVSAGVRWDMPQAPPGLKDKDEFATVLRAPESWTTRSFTFTSDPDKRVTRAVVLLKAYGGVKASFRNVRIVEGWYAPLRPRFKRPFKAGERSW